MRRIFAAVLALLILAGCTGEPVSNGLMAGASPDTSALSLYFYDGEQGHRSYIFDADTTRKVLAELDSVKATQAVNWTLADVKPPLYGLWISKTDGWSLNVAWSNGYWVAQDGTA